MSSAWNYSLHRKVSVPSALLPRSRDRTVLFLSGSVFVLIIASSTTPRDVTGVVPSSVFKLMNGNVKKENYLGVPQLIAVVSLWIRSKISFL